MIPQASQAAAEQARKEGCRRCRRHKPRQGGEVRNEEGFHNLQLSACARVLELESENGLGGSAACWLMPGSPEASLAHSMRCQNLKSRSVCAGTASPLMAPHRSAGDSVAVGPALPGALRGSRSRARRWKAASSLSLAARCRTRDRSRQMRLCHPRQVNSPCSQ